MVICDNCGHNYAENEARQNSISQCPRCCDDFQKRRLAHVTSRFDSIKRVTAAVSRNKLRVLVALAILLAIGIAGYYFGKPPVAQYLLKREHERLHIESVQEAKLVLSRRAAQGQKGLSISCAQILHTAGLYSVAKNNGVPLSEALSLFEYEPIFDADQKTFLKPFITVTYVNDYSVEQSRAFAVAACKAGK